MPLSHRSARRLRPPVSGLHDLKTAAARPATRFVFQARKEGGGGNEAKKKVSSSKASSFHMGKEDFPETSTDTLEVRSKLSWPQPAASLAGEIGHFIIASVVKKEGY